MPLHLDALRWGARRYRPGGRGAPVEAQRSDLARVEVAQLPGSPVHLFGLEMGPLIPEFITVSEQPLGFLVFCLRFHLEGLSVLVGQAVLSLLDFLVQCFAQLSAQLSIRQTSLTPSFWTLTFFLGLTSALAAGPGLWRAAERLVTVADWCFNAGIQKVILGVPVIPFFFGVSKTPSPLYTAPEVRVPSFFILFLICIFILLFCFDVVQKFGKIWII